MPITRRDDLGNYFTEYNGSGPISGTSATLTGPLAHGQSTGTAQAIATSGTIPTTNGDARCNPGAAVTGVILQPGTSNGQEVTVLNEAAAANTITFAAAGTSNVADGVGSALAGLTCRSFTWSSAKSLWYRTA